MMNTLRRTLALMLSAAALAGPAAATGTASSLSSDAASTSVGSVSTSFERSSDSSSGRRRADAGDYRVLDVADAPQRPGTARLRLRPLKDAGVDGEFFLYLPLQALTDARVVAGEIVTARLRPYGYEFARADTRQPFFLVLSEPWFRELQTRPVPL